MRRDLSSVGKIYEFSGTAATAAAITALSRRTVHVNKGRGSDSFTRLSVTGAGSDCKALLILEVAHFVLPNIRVSTRAAGTAIMPREFPRHDEFRVQATSSSCARRYCAHARRRC